MIVCVESNFILELAFLRDEHEACAQLLVLAKTHALRLAVPAFSVGETYEVLVRRAKQRSDLHNRLRTELGELARSQPYQQSSTQFEAMTGVLIRSSEDEKRRLDEGLDRILNTADIIPIELRTIRAAIAYQQSRALSPQTPSCMHRSSSIWPSRPVKRPASSRRTRRTSITPISKASCKCTIAACSHGSAIPLAMFRARLQNLTVLIPINDGDRSVDLLICYRKPDRNCAGLRRTRWRCGDDNSRLAQTSGLSPSG